MRSLSIRASLMLWFVALTTVLLVAFSFLVYQSLRSSLHSGIDARLAERARGLIAMCEWEEDDAAVEFNWTAETGSSLTSSASGKFSEVVLWPSGKSLFRSKGFAFADAPFSRGDSSQGEQLVFRSVRWNGQEVRTCSALASFAAMPRSDQDAGRPPFALVARTSESLREVQAQLANIKLLIGMLCGVALVFVIGFGAFLSRRFVRPLAALSEAAADVQAGDHKPMPHRGSGDEIDELANALDESFGRLRRMLERQTRFTADAAHELQNPIATIQNVAEIARRRERNPEEYDRFLEDIQVTSQRMGRIVASLLTLARLDSGSLRERFDVLSLGELIHESLANYSPGERARIAHSNGTASAVIGDRTLLGVLVENLIGNALRHAGPNAEIHLSTDTGDDGCTLRVQDDGKGIPPEEVERIFDRFHRVAQANPNAMGAGLGLSIVAEIAHLHGATCTIESLEPGTSVIVQFPSPDRMTTPAASETP